MAEREGTWAAAPERPHRGEARCLSPKGELRASSAGADKLRSSAQLAPARHRLAVAHTTGTLQRAWVWIDTRNPLVDDAGHAQAFLGFPETA